MKILKLLNSKYLLITLIFFIIIISSAKSNEPVDIWNLENKENIKKTPEVESQDFEEEISTNSIYKMQSQKESKLTVQEDETLLSKKIKIVGLYDPEENGLSINMWSNSDGEKILNILDKISKTKLSDDAKKILNVTLLTNSYFAQEKNDSEKFLKSKVDWLIKNNDFKLIEDFIIKNEDTNKNLKLIKFLADQNLSMSNIEKSCNIFSKIKISLDEDYLSKFNIYCLINSNKREEAQILFDLKKEMDFSDLFFEEKFNYLMDYDKSKFDSISTQSILDFHLSHRTNPGFIFEPNDLTSQLIWRYLSTSNLLDSVENIDVNDEVKISIIEKAVHERNYSEKELFNLYKRFQFNIDQLLTVKQSHKLLTNIEGRALLYQGILITSDIESKLDLIKTLKDSFSKEGNENAFKDELSFFLKNIDLNEVPSNFVSFYGEFLNHEKLNLTKIKINNKIIHQSKLLNYFRFNKEKKNIEKNLNDLLKKIKKEKDYNISIKDIILIESLKSDGIKIKKQYAGMYELNTSNMPPDIQDLINNDEMGMVLLRIVEILGEDELNDIGSDALYFIISALNQLNIDPLRNKILLKVLPLKV